MNVATPELATAVGLVTETPPDVIVAVTVEPSEVTGKLAESSIVTTGTAAKTAPLLADVDGAVVMTNFYAAPNADADVTTPIKKRDAASVLMTTPLTTAELRLTPYRLRTFMFRLTFFVGFSTCEAADSSTLTFIVPVANPQELLCSSSTGRCELKCAEACRVPTIRRNPIRRP